MLKAKSIRQNWVDATKGLCSSLILLVHVLISIWETGLVHSNIGWDTAIIVLRSFLIATVFVISGLFLRYRLRSGTGRLFRNWLVAIVWPYLVWGTVVVVAERVLGGLRNPVDTAPNDVRLLWTPIGWLWFLYVFAIFQLLAVTCRRAPLALVALGLAGVVADALWPLPILAHLACYFLIFYAVGVAFGPRLVAWRIPPALGVGGLIAVAPLALVAVPDLAHVWTWPELPATCAGAIGLCWLGQRFETSRVLLYLGRRSMAIYVVHIFFIAGTRIVLVKVFGVTSLPVLFAACLSAGFAGAIATYEIAARLGITVIAGLGFPAYAGRRAARPEFSAAPSP